MKDGAWMVTQDFDKTLDGNGSKRAHKERDLVYL